jgi:hypothetical protein
MKKPRHRGRPSLGKIQIRVALSPDLHDWATREAFRLGLDRSFFVESILRVKKEGGVA